MCAQSSPAPAASSSPATLYNTVAAVCGGRACPGDGADLALRVGRRLSRRPEAAPRGAARLDARRVARAVRRPRLRRHRPVQERVYAQYAGLGWIGKNTCLINPELGSWLFLVGDHLHAAARARRPGLDQCGACTKCLEACPTGRARRAGRARRDAVPLVSDDRAAHEIPARIAAGARPHVYGCDICQDVCPYNQAAPQSDDAGVAAAAGPRPAALVELWRRPDADLRALIKGSADDARQAHRPAPQSRRRHRQQRRRCAPATSWTSAAPTGRPRRTRWSSEHVEWASDVIGA